MILSKFNGYLVQQLLGSTVGRVDSGLIDNYSGRQFFKSAGSRASKKKTTLARSSRTILPSTDNEEVRGSQGVNLCEVLLTLKSGFDGKEEKIEQNIE